MTTLDQDLKKLKSLSSKLSSKGIEKNPHKLKTLTEEYKKLSQIIEIKKRINVIKEQIGESETLINDRDKAISELAKEEVEKLKKNLKKNEYALDNLLKPIDKNDHKNVIIEIRAGTGGIEAALFASDLFRMYSKFAEKLGFKVDILSINKLSEGGFKEIIANIRGKNAYKKLKHESGVHRVQRIPVTETSGRIHTSAASVVILPEVDDIEIKIDPQDMRIDTFRAGGPGGQSVNTTDSAIRITHIPTSIVVSCQDEKSQHKNKSKAMKILKSRLYDYEEQKLIGKTDELRKDAIKTGDRSAKIRTYNFPQSRVTDHRIKKSWHNLESILDGNIDEIISSLEDIS